MASTVLSDVDYNSNAFASAVSGYFTQRLEFLNSGILANIPDSVLASNTTGHFAHFPHYSTISGDSVQITTSVSTTVNSLATFDNIAAWVEREKAWGADQIIRTVAGLDPAEEVAKQLGEYWAGEIHRDALLRLGGAFTTALASTHSTGSAYSPATITLEGGVAAKQLLGDNQDLLTSVVMNSKVKSDAMLKKIITELAGTSGAVDAYNSGSIEMFLGSKVYSSDKLTATSSVYPTYFAAQGAIGYKFRNRTASSQTNAEVFRINAGGLNVEVEKHRVALTAGGQDVLISRASYLSHPFGTAWDVSTANPTDAQLATDTNWSKVATDDKLIRIVQLNTL